MIAGTVFVKSRIDTDAGASKCFVNRTIVVGSYQRNSQRLSPFTPQSQ